MNSSELLDLFRKEMSDSAEPYLWSDEEIFNFEDDAQAMFCRKTDGIRDSTTAAVTKLALTPGTSVLAIHATIKRIRNARRGDTGRPLEIINADDMPKRGWYFDGTAGEPKALILGMDEDSARVWPVPNTASQFIYATTAEVALDASTVPLTSVDGLYVGQLVRGTGIAASTTISSITDLDIVLSTPTTAIIADATSLTFDLTVDLSVFRLPLASITDVGDQTFEVPAEHHRHLMLWMKHLAYSKQDAEAFNRTKAEEFEKRFYAYCAQVQEEERRKAFKVRTVAYGGI
jgi:hypothetical protein